MAPSPNDSSPTNSTPLTYRLAARASTLTTTTASLAPGHMQANLIVLPSRYAPSFRLLCRRNPVPCPLLAETLPGEPTVLISHTEGLSPDELARDIDLSRDAPAYVVYRDGERVRGGGDRKGDGDVGGARVKGEGRVLNVRAEWSSDHIGFLIGCSFGFEGGLCERGLRPRHQVEGRTVAMYRTGVGLCASGVFKNSTYVVSMRPYTPSQIPLVREITRAYNLCHGEPIDWGWDALKRLGIADLERPQWGDAPGLPRCNAGMGQEGKGERDGEEGEEEKGEGEEEELVPVFWGCGVTPQEAVMRSGIEGVVMAHEPGCMIICDAKSGGGDGGGI